MLQGVIELLGPEGSGKSILSQMLVKTLQPANVLLIDACSDQGLSHQVLPKIALSQHQSLTKLVQHFIDHETQYRLQGSGPGQKQSAQQAIDWAFSNLPVSIALDEETETDLLTVGLLTERLPQSIQQMLEYGLTRLFETYDYVVLDGYHPRVHTGIPEPRVSEPLLHTLLVSRDTGEFSIPGELKALETPYLLITQYDGKPLSDALQTLLNEQSLRLIGKMPVFSLEEALTPELLNQFHDCLRFLALPIFQTRAH